jgi:hypothetical protein
MQIRPSNFFRLNFKGRAIKLTFVKKKLTVENYIFSSIIANVCWRLRLVQAAFQKKVISTLKQINVVFRKNGLFLYFDNISQFEK